MIDMVIIEKAASFFLVLLLGILLRRKCAANAEILNILTKICINITLPAAVVTGFSSGRFRAGFFLIAAAGFLLNWLAIEIGLLLSRGKSAGERATDCLSMTGYNIGSFIIPLVQEFLSADLISIVCFFDFGNALMTLGGSYFVVSAITGQRQDTFWRSFRQRVFHSPPLLTEICMVLLSSIGIAVPKGILSILSPISNANFFVSILAVGVMLDFHINQKQFFQILQFVLIRMVFTIGSAFLLWAVLPFSSEIRLAVELAVCAPISMLSPLYTGLCGGDTAVASLTYSAYIFISITLIFTLIAAF